MQVGGLESVAATLTTPPTHPGGVADGGAGGLQDFVDGTGLRLQGLKRPKLLLREGGDRKEEKQS